MPEPSVREVRRPELRLPEIKRDEIVKALSGIRLPDVEIPRIDAPRFDRSKLDLSRVDLSRVELPDLSKVDLRGAVESAAIRAGVKERTRARWGIAIGVAIVAGLGLWAILRRPAVRAQVEESARRTRARIDRMREDRAEMNSEADDADDATDATMTETPAGDVSAGIPVMATDLAVEDPTAVVRDLPIPESSDVPA